MKRNIVLLMFFSGLITTSCEKDTESVSRTVDVSFPTIDLAGDNPVFLPVGGAFTEAGATGTDDITGETTPLEPVVNDVNTAEAGLYIVEYTARNSNGYETTVDRVVTVTSVVDPVDYTGNYPRTTNGSVCTITKLSEGVYEVGNPGGAPGLEDITVIMVETAPGVFEAPTQYTEVNGPFALVDIQYNAATSAFSWIVNSSGFGTARRFFVKQ